MANATSEVGIHHIQKQIDNCDEIVANIDKIVPKLYKIRQQALAQKEYVNDIQRELLTNGLASVDGTTKIATFTTTPLSSIVSSSYESAAFNVNATAEQRCVIQSLFKYNHDVGTSTHFTTEQIGVVDDRTKGLNLQDVVNITTSLDSLLSSSNSSPAANTNLNSLILKPKNPPATGSVIPDTTTPLTDGISISSYGTDTVNGLDSHLTTALSLTASDNIVGFGLT